MFRFGVVYLCGLFWGAPTTGTDSKAGTIVHQASHFTANGGTNDMRDYESVSGSKELAANYPDIAIRTADNYEYFAENNPVLQ